MQQQPPVPGSAATPPPVIGQGAHPHLHGVVPLASAPLPLTGTGVGASSSPSGLPTAAGGGDKLPMSSAFAMANLAVAGAVPIAVPGAVPGAGGSSSGASASMMSSLAPIVGTPGGSPFAHSVTGALPFHTIAPPSPMISSSPSVAGGVIAHHSIGANTGSARGANGSSSATKKRSRSPSPAPPPPPSNVAAGGNGVPSLLNMSRSLELQHSAVPTVSPFAMMTPGGVPVTSDTGGGVGGAAVVAAAAAAAAYGYSPGLPIHPLPGEPPPPPPPANPPPEDPNEAKTLLLGKRPRATTSAPPPPPPPHQSSSSTEQTDINSMFIPVRPSGLPRPKKKRKTSSSGTGGDTKRKRRTPEEIRAQWDRGDKRGLWKCPLCARVIHFHMRRSHPCYQDFIAGPHELQRERQLLVEAAVRDARGIAHPLEGMPASARRLRVANAAKKKPPVPKPKPEPKPRSPRPPGWKKRTSAELLALWNAGKRDDLWKCEHCAKVIHKKMKRRHPCYYLMNGLTYYRRDKAKKRDGTSSGSGSTPKAVVKEKSVAEEVSDKPPPPPVPDSKKKRSVGEPAPVSAEKRGGNTISSRVGSRRVARQDKGKGRRGSEAVPAARRASPSPPPPRPRPEQKATRNRRTPEDIRAQWNRGKRSKLWLCPVCDKVIHRSMSRKHPCVAAKVRRGENIEALLAKGGAHNNRHTLPRAMRGANRIRMTKSPQKRPQSPKFLPQAPSRASPHSSHSAVSSSNSALPPLPAPHVSRRPVPFLPRRPRPPNRFSILHTQPPADSIARRKPRRTLRKPRHITENEDLDSGGSGIDLTSSDDEESTDSDEDDTSESDTSSDSESSSTSASDYTSVDADEDELENSAGGDGKRTAKARVPTASASPYHLWPRDPDEGEDSESSSSSSSSDGDVRARRKSEKNVKRASRTFKQRGRDAAASRVRSVNGSDSSASASYGRRFSVKEEVVPSEKRKRRVSFALEDTHIGAKNDSSMKETRSDTSDGEQSSESSGRSEVSEGESVSSSSHQQTAPRRRFATKKVFSKNSMRKSTHRHSRSPSRPGEDDLGSSSGESSESDVSGRSKSSGAGPSHKKRKVLNERDGEDQREARSVVSRTVTHHVSSKDDSHDGDASSGDQVSLASTGGQGSSTPASAERKTQRTPRRVVVSRKSSGTEGSRCENGTKQDESERGADSGARPSSESESDLVSASSSSSSSPSQTIGAHVKADAGRPQRRRRRWSFPGCTVPTSCRHRAAASASSRGRSASEPDVYAAAAAAAVFAQAASESSGEGLEEFDDSADSDESVCYLSDGAEDLEGYTKELKARVVAYHFFTEPAPSWKDTAQRFNVPYQTVRKWCRTKSPWQAESEALNEAEVERRAQEAASYYFDQGRQMTIPRVAKMYGLKEHLVRQAIHKSPLRQHNNDAFKAQRTRYSDDFKQTCLNYYFNSETKHSQEKTCAHFGVSSATFSKWVRDDPRRKQHPNIARFDHVNQFNRTKTDVFRQKRPGRRFFSPAFKQKLVDFFLAMDQPDHVKTAHHFGVPPTSANMWITTYLAALVEGANMWITTYLATNPHLTPQARVQKKPKEYSETSFPTAKWYPDQLKRELVEFHFAMDGRTLADTSREFGLPRRTVGKWIRKFKDAEKAAKFEPDPSQIPDSLKLFVDISSESRKKREALQFYFADDSHSMEDTFQKFGTTPDQIRAWLANRWLPPSEGFSGNPSLQQKAVGFYFISDLHSFTKTSEVFNQDINVVKSWVETSNRWVPLPAIPYSDNVKQMVLAKASDGSTPMKQISHETQVHYEQVRQWVIEKDVALLNEGEEDTDEDDVASGVVPAPPPPAPPANGVVDIDMTTLTPLPPASASAAADGSGAPTAVVITPLDPSAAAAASPLPSLPLPMSSSSPSPAAMPSPLPPVAPLFAGTPLTSHDKHTASSSSQPSQSSPSPTSASTPRTAPLPSQQNTDTDGDTVMADIVNGVEPAASSESQMPPGLSMSAKGVHVPPAFGTPVNPTVSVLTDISKTVRYNIQAKHYAHKPLPLPHEAANGAGAASNGLGQVDHSHQQQQQQQQVMPPPPPPPGSSSSGGGEADGGDNQMMSF